MICAYKVFSQPGIAAAIARTVRAANSSASLTPHVEEFGIGRSRDCELALLALPAQGGAHVLLGVIQCLERDLRGFARSKSFHVRQNVGHDLAMLAVAALRDVNLVHGFKHRLANGLCLLRHGRSPFSLT